MMIESITVMVENTFLAFGGKYIRRVTLFQGGPRGSDILRQQIGIPIDGHEFCILLCQRISICL